MKSEKEYVKWVFQMFKKYAPVLFLDKYHFRVELDKEKRYMASKFNYPYLDITILYSQESLDDWIKDKRDAERRLIHEFCHSITDPYYCVTTDRYVSKNQLEDARERLNDHIAQIVNKHFNLL